LSGLAHRHGGYDLRLLLMTDSLGAAGRRRAEDAPPGRNPAPMRYRHPGDVIRLVAEVIVVVATRPPPLDATAIPEGGAVH
jgi:hypothetical protein